MRPLTLLLALVGVAAGCNNPNALIATGLVGEVVRGPTQPVCVPNVPCEAGFAAKFWVMSGGFNVGSFTSDSAGHFEVRLVEGSYVIVPDPSAPILDPTSQTREVVVQPYTLTLIHLEFDTGIR